MKYFFFQAEDGIPAGRVTGVQTCALPISGQVAAPYRETNGFAIVSALLGVAWFAGIGSVLALVFGYRARREIKRSGGRQKGLGLATAGIILGWIGIAMLLVAVGSGLALFAASTGTGTGSPGPG